MIPNASVVLIDDRSEVACDDGQGRACAAEADVAFDARLDARDSALKCRTRAGRSYAA